MVMPDREVPGMSATACHSPMTSAWRSVHSDAARACAPVRSAHRRTRPKTSVVQPITATDRVASANPVSDSAKPATITGTVATTRHSAR